MYYQGFQENRLWQQFYWKLKDDKEKQIAYRIHLEEIALNNHSQNLIVLRQLISHERLYNYFGCINPFIYDEVFFQLNNPNYLSKSLISENRIFLGFKMTLANQSYWKIGYMNQYQKDARQSYLNHVISINYVFGENKINVPIDS